jgi:2'-5' RNA ligase
MRKPQSAIIVRIDLPTLLERIRRRYVPVARLGVPPHVTILYPFLEPAALNDSVRRRLVAIAARTTAFDVEFTTVETFPDAIYLAPAPAEPFQQLTTDIIAGFPTVVPYGDPSLTAGELIPHLTIAMHEPSWAIQHIATTRLPMRATVRRLTVITEGAGGRWETRWRIPLARP